MRIRHQLKDEFAPSKLLIQRLKRESEQFRRLATRYDEINRSINRIEFDNEPSTDEVLERLKKQRLMLKDEIAEILHKVEARM